MLLLLLFVSIFIFEIIILTLFYMLYKKEHKQFICSHNWILSENINNAKWKCLYCGQEENIFN
jgi:membrane-associated PAP2 superfamily phosphatase